jgi:hypothetical protein
LFFSCQSADSRFRRLSRQFMAERPQPELFRLVDGADTLALPLPPSDSVLARTAMVVDDFRKRLEAVEEQALGEENRAALLYFRRALDSLALHPGRTASDPGQYTLDELLVHFIGRVGGVRNPGLLTQLVENVPAYYASVEGRWIEPDTSEAETAVSRSLRVLEQLKELEEKLPAYSVGYRERLQKALPSARYAVKDFIGLCRSSRL